ncbi:MAG: 23S rRNA (guanosine(2251)-2'-O)-methyltransferase RlmB [Candidatus Caccovivens sp.]
MKIEGKNQVIEALKNDATINKIIVDKNFMTRKDDVISLAKKSKIRIEFLPKKVMDTLSVTGHHQGYIAETVEFEYSNVEDILQNAKEKNHTPFVVLLDGIEDPHNLGAIIRTCECAGVDGIIIPKIRACQVNETVVRTSAGAISNIKIARVTNLKEAIDTLKENGLWIYACELGGTNIYSQNLTGPIGIVIGSEGNGIKPSIQAYCDGVVTLPLFGSVNSLNASVSAGIAIYEIVRQRLK